MWYGWVVVWKWFWYFLCIYSAVNKLNVADRIHAFGDYTRRPAWGRGVRLVTGPNNRVIKPRIGIHTWHLHSTNLFDKTYY